MGREVVRLIMIGYDYMEPVFHRAEYRECLGVFEDDDDYGGLSAEDKIREFLKTQPKRHTYTAYNGQKYPKYKLKREEAR